MAEISWEQVSAVCDDNNVITVIVRELSDGTPTGKTSSARLYKDHEEFDIDIKILLKRKIVHDRAKTNEADKINIDFSGFEDFIKE